MNALMRRLVVERDGRQCVYCKGACPFLKGEKCNLPAKTLSAAAYWRLDGLRSPLGRLQVDHTFGKTHEEWNEVAVLCPCCHAKKVTGGGPVFEAEMEYLATVGPEPDEYRIAHEQEAAEKPVRKTARKAKAKEYRRATKERLKRPASKLKSKHRNAGRSTPVKPARGVRKRSGSTSDAPTFRMKYSRISTKDEEQRARPNYNSFKHP